MIHGDGGKFQLRPRPKRLQEGADRDDDKLVARLAEHRTALLRRSDHLKGFAAHHDGLSHGIAVEKETL